MRAVDLINKLIRQLQHHNFCSEVNNRSAMNLNEVVKCLTKFASPSLAGSWDNVGLLVEPSPPHIVTQAMLTNDLTEAVLDEALEKQCNLIISYHPPIFKGLKRLTQRTWKERIVVKAIENRIAIYSPHTSWDAVQGGVNDWLCKAFDFEKVDPLHQSKSKAFLAPFKFQLHSSVSSSDMNAIVSKFNDMEEVKLLDVITNNKNHLTKLEYNCTDKGLLDILSSGILNEDAKKTTQIIELAKPPLPGIGMGRKITMNDQMTIKEVVCSIKKHLCLSHVRLAFATDHDLDSKVKTIALCAGSGASVLQGCKSDIYWTGEMSHHEVLDAVSNGITVVLCDHSNTERGYLLDIQQMLLKTLDAKIGIIVSTLDKDPLQVV